jgi:hypothetical protein
MSKDRERGLRSSFRFGKPGAASWEQRLIAEVFFHETKLVKAALRVREQGPSYLRYLPINVIQNMLRNFATENYWHLVDDTFMTRQMTSFNQIVSPSAKAALSEALLASNILTPANELTVYPLVPVKVLDNFASEPFLLLDAQSLAPPYLPKNINPSQVVPTRFPPWLPEQERGETPSSWLGVSSPALNASNKMRAAILGALSLTPLPGYRYMFSLRKIFGGYCTFSQGGMACSFGEPHTPRLSEDITIQASDHPWLSILATKLLSNDQTFRRQIHALEYFYRAWPLDAPERFPVLCMTLDAIFGQQDNATQAVIDGVQRTLGAHIRHERLRLLMKLRNSVLHGGAPDVYDSRNYSRYYDTYEADPIYDLELITAKCLRLLIFGDKMIEQPDPYADIIAEAQAQGKLPKDLSRRSILEDREPARN